MLMARVIAVALAGIAWQTPGCRPSLTCVAFESAPLSAGQSYSHPMQHGLVFRFTAEPARGLGSDQRVWHITVGPVAPDDHIDYVWPVSLPINSAHHLFVGPGLDWTAKESVMLNPRRLRFVLTPQELESAETAHTQATKQVIAGSAIDADGLRRIGPGELTVTLRDVTLDAGRIESLRLAVRSCVPA